MGYSYKKGNQRPSRSLNRNLDVHRKEFREFKDSLQKLNFILVFIDECSFCQSNLPLYTWAKKGEKPEILIRDSTRFNAIAAQWRNEVYFVMKQATSTENEFCMFLEKLVKELKRRLTKNQFEKRTVFILDNARIHKTNKV